MKSLSTQASFGTIRNNTALKHSQKRSVDAPRFGTIRNNTALKPKSLKMLGSDGFGTIRNNTALKLTLRLLRFILSFGTIRNNTALKPRRRIFLTKFRNRAIRLSQTSARLIPLLLLLYHIFRIQEIVLIQHILRKIIYFSRFDK